MANNPAGTRLGVALAESPAFSKKPGERWVVVPGFISPYKGHPDAVAAVERLPDHFRLVIAG